MSTTEAINQLLNHAGLVVVIMADMQTIAKCAEIKYKELTEREDNATHPLTAGPEPGFGWVYTQKTTLRVFMSSDVQLAPMMGRIVRFQPAEEAEPRKL